MALNFYGPFAKKDDDEEQQQKAQITSRKVETGGAKGMTFYGQFADVEPIYPQPEPQEPTPTPTYEREEEDKGIFGKIFERAKDFVGLGKEEPEVEQPKKRGFEEEYNKIPVSIQQRLVENEELVNEFNQRIQEIESGQGFVRDFSEDVLSTIQATGLLPVFEESSPKEAELKEAIRKLETSQDIYGNLLKEEENNRGFFKTLFSGRLSDVVVPEQLRISNEARTAYDVEQKVKRGEDISELERATYERARARVINEAINNNAGKAVAKIIKNIPSYMLTFAMGNPEFQSVKTSTIQALSPTRLNTVAKEILGWTAGNLAHSTSTNMGNLARLSAKTEEYALPNYELMVGKQGNYIVKKVDEGDDFNRAFNRAFGSNAVEIFSERTGGLLNKPLSWVKKATIGSFSKKLGLEGAEQVIKIANKAGWDGVIEEVFEEEVAAPLQAQIEETKYYAPWTKEGLARLGIEFAGIGAFGAGMAGTGVALNKITGGEQYDIAEIDIPVKGEVEQGAIEDEEDKMEDREKRGELPEVMERELTRTPEALKPYTEEATDYQSGSDFAKAVFSAGGSDQIGFMSPAEIIARDEVDRSTVESIKERIEADEKIEPIEITYNEEGGLETVEGSHRLTAHKELGEPVPYVYRGEEKIEGSYTFNELYDVASKVTEPEGVSKATIPEVIWNNSAVELAENPKITSLSKEEFVDYGLEAYKQTDEYQSLLEEGEEIPALNSERNQFSQMYESMQDQVGGIEPETKNSVVHLPIPDHNVYARINEDLYHKLKEEVKYIEFEEIDKPHLTPLNSFQYGEEAEEVDLEHIRNMSDNMRLAVALAELDLNELDTEEIGGFTYVKDLKDLREVAVPGKGNYRLGEIYVQRTPHMPDNLTPVIVAGPMKNGKVPAIAVNPDTGAELPLGIPEDQLYTQEELERDIEAEQPQEEKEREAKIPNELQDILDLAEGANTVTDFVQAVENTLDSEDTKQSITNFMPEIPRFGNPLDHFFHYVQDNLKPEYMPRGLSNNEVVRRFYNAESTTEYVETKEHLNKMVSTRSGVLGFTEEAKRSENVEQFASAVRERLTEELANMQDQYTKEDLVDNPSIIDGLMSGFNQTIIEQLDVDSIGDYFEKAKSGELVEASNRISLSEAEKRDQARIENYKEKLMKLDETPQVVPHPYTDGQTIRPFLTGYGCDGSTDNNVVYEASRVYREILGKDLEWVEDQYSEYDKIKINPDKLEDEAIEGALVKNTTIIPPDATLEDVINDLHEINHHSTAQELQEMLENAGFDLDENVLEEMENETSPESEGNVQIDSAYYDTDIFNRAGDTIADEGGHEEFIERTEDLVDSTLEEISNEEFVTEETPETDYRGEAYTFENEELKPLANPIRIFGSIPTKRDYESFLTDKYGVTLLSDSDEVTKTELEDIENIETFWNARQGNTQEKPTFKSEHREDEVALENFFETYRRVNELDNPPVAFTKPQTKKLAGMSIKMGAGGPFKKNEEILDNLDYFRRSVKEDGGTMPILERVAVEDGTAQMTDLTQFLEFSVDKEDGVYELVGTDLIKTKDDINEFPEPSIAQDKITTIKTDTLLDIFKKHKRFVSTDSGRATLMGTHLVFTPGGMYAESVDGHKSFHEYHEDVKTDERYEFIVPDTKLVARTIKAFKNTDTLDVNLSAYEAQNGDKMSVMTFENDYGRLTLRGVEGDFPTIATTAPGFEKKYTVDRTEFRHKIGELKDYMKKADTKVFSMRVDEENNEITLLTNLPIDDDIVTKEVSFNYEEISEEAIKQQSLPPGGLIMPVRISDEARAPSGDVAFNYKYMDKLLMSLDSDQVDLHFNIEGGEIQVLKPALVTEPDIEIDGAGTQTADKGGYTDVESGKKHVNSYQPIDFPELVSITRELLNAPPELNHRLRRNLGRLVAHEISGEAMAAAVETPAEDRATIELNPEIFKDPDLMRKTLAHEIGHLADFLPEGTLKRGRLVGRVANLNNYLKHEFGDLDDDVLREELKSLTQMWKPFNERLNANYTKYRYSSKELYADAVSVLLNDPALLKEHAPNFWKGFFDYADRNPEVEETLRNTWNLLHEGEEAVMSKRQEDIRDMFDEAEDRHKILREEQKQKDKDFIFKMKYELIDRNQRLIDLVNEAESKGDPVSPDANPVYWLEENNYVGGKVKNFIQENVSPIYDQIQSKDGVTWEDFGELLFLERVIHERGTVPNPADHLLHKLGAEEWSKYEEKLPDDFRDKPAREQLAVLKDEFGSMESRKGKTLYESLMEELPKSIANPLGFTVKTAKEQRQFLKDNMTKDQWQAMTSAMEQFREVNQELLEMAEDAGIYSSDLVQELEANPAYATFQVLDYMDTTISSSIKPQVGTLKGISNPAGSTVIKMISTLRAIERNKTKQATVGFLKNRFPEEIEPAKTRWTGKRNEPVENYRDSDKSLYTVMEDGKLKGYYVDPYVAKTMDYWSTGYNNAVLEVFKFFNTKLFRPMFITFNLGFQTFNLVRDFTRFWKNMPDTGLFQSIKAYGKAAPSAWNRAFDNYDEVIAEMEEKKILGLTWNDIIEGRDREETRMEDVLTRAGLDYAKEEKARGPLMKQAKGLLNTIKRFGDFIETIPKVAGYQELNGKMPTKEMAHHIRTKVGSPDFLRGGAGYGWYNEVFLFSNAIKEGIRADIDAATDPQTRSGYWMKTAGAELVPKMLMAAALMGLFGEPLRRMLENVSEYDKTNYKIIPLGIRNGKTQYIRIPSDEMGRLIGALFWKGLRMANNNRPFVEDVTDILSFTGGQLPSVSPLVTTAQTTAQFLAGKNPYDAFRGRTVIPEREFEAGGKYALKPFLTWQFKNLGGGIIWRTYTTMEAPESKSWIQKIHDSPIISNIIGRWVKESDWGQREKNDRIIRKVEKKQARRVLEEQRAVEGAVEKYVKGEQSMMRRRQIERELAEEIVGDEPLTGEVKAHRTRRLKQFRQLIAIQEEGQDFSSLVYANTNDEKVALLENMRSERDPEVFRKLMRKLLKYKIISENVARELQRNE